MKPKIKIISKQYAYIALRLFIRHVPLKSEDILACTSVCLSIYIYQFSSYWKIFVKFGSGDFRDKFL